MVADAPSASGFSPYAAPSMKATSKGFPALRPPLESAPRVEIHEEVPMASAAKVPMRRPALLIVIGLVALGAGIGGGVWLLQRPKTTAPAATATAAEPPAPATGEPESIPSPPKPEAPASVDIAPSPAPSASVAPEAPSPSAKAPPTEKAPPEAPAAPQTIPPPTFNLEAIPGDRAALLVRSSAQAHVLVHGKDYGETNQYLLTSCGIRFVRLARGFNDFLEPGRSIVLKCGKLTELAIDPDEK
jgi:outer membrane biosynthesis protein TonB